MASIPSFRSRDVIIRLPFPNDVNGRTPDVLHRLHQTFSKGWMGMDHPGHLIHRGSHLQCQCSLMNQIRCVRAKNMHAKNLAGCGIGNDFEKASGITRGLRLAQSSVPEAADLSPPDRAPVRLPVPVLRACCSVSPHARSRAR